MADPKGDKLYVNLGASQTRRRLKGFGHGVRKIQSAGRNQAVIIHTATGRNLHELKAQFADVGFSIAATDLDEPIDNLANIGPSSAAWLRDVGILTIANLRSTGPADAYRLVKQRYSQANLNLLYSLAAGLAGKDWRMLSEEEKDDLRQKCR